MRKKIIAVLALLCLLGGTAAAASKFNPYSFQQSIRPVIPSLDAYMNDYISVGKVETKDYLVHRKYSGKPSNIIAVAEQYITLLQETYRFEVIDETWLDYGNYASVTCAFTLDTGKDLSSFQIYNDENGVHWETPYCNVIVQYTVPDSGYAFIHLYYSPELRYEDTGDTYAPPGKSTTRKTTATPKPTQKTDTDSSATK